MKKTLLIMGLLLFLGCTSLEQQKNKNHYLIKGMNYSKAGNYTKAIEEYQQLYKIDEKNPILLREMGLAYSHLENYDIAEKYFLSAIEIDPKNQVTLINLSILYYRMNRLDKSREYLAKISKDSLDYRVVLLKGYIAYEEQKYEESYDEFTKVLNYIDIEDDLFVNTYVTVLQKTARTKEIYPFIYNIYENQKDNSNAVIAYSNYLIDVFDDYNGALKVLKEFLVREKNDDVILELAKLNFEVGKINQSKLYLKLLTDAYNYDLNVLNLKKEIAISENNLSEAKKYNRIIEKVSDL